MCHKPDTERNSAMFHLRSEFKKHTEERLDCERVIKWDPTCPHTQNSGVDCSHVYLLLVNYTSKNSGCVWFIIYLSYIQQ